MTDAEKKTTFYSVSQFFPICSRLALDFEYPGVQQEKLLRTA